MKRTLTTIAAAVTVSFAIGSPAAAGTALPPSPMYSGRDTTEAFVGFNFTFGAGDVTPEGVLGVLHGRTDKNNDFNGAKASFHFNFRNGISARAIKLTGVTGGTETRGELGLGYSFANGTLFGTGGLTHSYFTLGGELGFDGSGLGYLGVQSIGDIDERRSKQQAAPN
ncbi:MAG: hypothetical protein WCD16_08510 [Paracoccaceae bacterium]